MFISNLKKYLFPEVEGGRGGRGGSGGRGGRRDSDER